MNKLLSTFAILSMVALFSPAQAAELNTSKIYVGSDVEFTALSGSTINDLRGANLHIGTRLNKNFGLEAGIGKTIVARTGNVKAGIVSTYADAIGYLPVTAGGDLELLATAGISYDILRASKIGVKADDKAFGLVVGAGAQLHLTDRIALRTLVKIEDVNLSTIGIDKKVKYTAGINYSF